MALVLDTLKSGLVTLFTIPSLTVEQFGSTFVDIYDGYAQQGMALSGLTPTSVNTEICRSKMLDTLRKTPDNYLEPAVEWSVAFEAYWTLGVFGATGTVTAITGTLALGQGLKDIWEMTAMAAGAITAANVAEAIATALDAYTRTVIVTDTALPPPSGSVGPIS